MNFNKLNNIDELVWYHRFADDTYVYKTELNIPIPPILIQILNNFQENGFTGLIVGGAVRDSILGIQSKDIDIEVYGTNYENLHKILTKFGRADLVGAAFGIIKFKDSAGNDFDFSLPRRDSKMPSGDTATRGRGFVTTIDENMSPKEAAFRRDFTINSMAYNPLTKEIYDFFGGVQDLENKILRATSPSFAEDPLRVLRGMQFAARFGMQIEPETAKLAASLKDQPLVIERVTEEWMKLFTKGKYPEKVLQYLADTQWIDNYPELKNIMDVPQDPEWHPEGSCGAHISLTLQAAAKMADENQIQGEDRAVLMIAALTHDLGKATTTKTEMTPTGERITSKGHDIESGKLSKQFMERIGIKQSIIQQVVPLVSHHMVHLNFNEKSKNSNIRQIAEHLFPATIKQLEFIVRSDSMGRGTGVAQPNREIKNKKMFDLAKEEGVYEGKIPQLLQGRDIIENFPSIKPGEIFRDVLEFVRQKQLQGAISTYEEALVTANDFLRQKLAFLNGNDVIETFKDIYGDKGGPYIKDILLAAWEAQKSNEITTREDALNWLQEYKNTFDSDNEYTNVESIDELIKKYASNQKFEIYSDADNCITDFIKEFEKFGKGSPKEFEKTHTEEALWNLIRSKTDHFWLNMDWMPDGKKLWNFIKTYNPTILTTPAPVPNCKEDKKNWFKKEIGNVPIIFSTKKEKYAGPNKILIDDMEKNIKSWEKAGGIGILHISTENTIKNLKKLLNENN
jgi:tRNA nucleotidyltransferase (CCA-adding enzyme)